MVTVFCLKKQNTVIQVVPRYLKELVFFFVRGPLSLVFEAVHVGEMVCTEFSGLTRLVGIRNQVRGCGGSSENAFALIRRGCFGTLREALG